jgi:heat shock protein HtpX
MLIGIASAAIAALLASVIRMAISRRREYLADAGSVELTKKPDAMISALIKVSGHAHLDAPEEVRGLFLENREEGFFGLFSTHPPIEKRIAALQQYAGGRVVEPAAPSFASPPAEGGFKPWGDPPKEGPWG